MKYREDLYHKQPVILELTEEEVGRLFYAIGQFDWNGLKDEGDSDVIQTFYNLLDEVMISRANS